MATATVKFWFPSSGFGFLRVGNGGPDLFVHVTGVASADGLTEGQTVSYEIGTDRKNGKTCAQNVRII